MFLGEH